MPARAPSRALAAEGAPRGGLAALCITQTTAWGILYYALIAAVGPISQDTGWDPALVTGAFSAGLLVSTAAGIAPVTATAVAAWFGTYTAMAWAWLPRR
ncbi:hypothetical protein [Arthrobacter sp. SLBN-122]|uniref:hypothetical protein n=1 Tax=Arthrobacter sp. SLBN-122 TaxID=2768455 RepID=UPI00116EA1C2|nr:hypothetical protein [Arthrobacter sp. SLBN-122]TQJ33639.1 hypothetical protein FBY36_0859 [Arthrobacter sp. SLBN-122]